MKSTTTQPEAATSKPLAFIGDAIKGRLAEMFDCGYWFCDHCDRTTEPLESDQGQPTVCKRCKSPRIRFNPPLHAVTVGDTKLIQPGQL